MRTRPSLLAALAGAAALTFLGGAAAADTGPEFKLVIKDHHFAPAELKVPAGQKLHIVVENQDPTPEEFESNDFNAEKVVGGKDTITVIIGPLDAGRYEYFGDFNPDVAKGVIIAE